MSQTKKEIEHVPKTTFVMSKKLHLKDFRLYNFTTTSIQ